jgi:hypothetical protein
MEQRALVRLAQQDRIKYWMADVDRGIAFGLQRLLTAKIVLSWLVCTALNPTQR